MDASLVDPKDYIITRKRKKYRFALFQNNLLCFEIEAWDKNITPNMIEVGAGTGLFSVAIAEKNPNISMVAIDVKADRLQTGAKEAVNRHLESLRFLRARADQIEDLFKPHSLESIWVTFPDPFPRERSAKHRLTHPHFLTRYRNLLSASGALYFKTDARALFLWSLEQLVQEGWKIEELSFDLHESQLMNDYKLKTTYETRYMDEGIPINFVRATPPRQADK